MGQWPQTPIELPLLMGAILGDGAVDPDSHRTAPSNGGNTVQAVIECDVISSESRISD